MVVYGPSLPPQPPVAPASSAPKVASEVSARPQASVSEVSLLDVLTEEEREFFAQQAQLGTLTYGPRKLNPHRPDAPMGQRVDVRA
jgi:hypothetical protein